MIYLSFRRSSLEDIDLYKICLSDEEFKYMLYNDNIVYLEKLENYISDNGEDLKFIASISDDGEKFKDLGFAHFYYKGDNEYTYVGGILPTYFDKGYGVYASIAMLLKIYNLYPEIQITTGIYKYNNRSLKLHLAMGFIEVGDNDNKKILRLTKCNFDNDFVKCIKSRMEII